MMMPVPAGRPLTLPLYAPGNLDSTFSLRAVTLDFQDSPLPLLVPEKLMEPGFHL